MFVNYPAVFLKEKDSDSYTVLFPDLNGCISYGDNLNESLKMAQDALGTYLLEYYTKAYLMPKASSLDEIEIKLDEDDKEYISYEDSFKNYVFLDLTDYVKKFSDKSVKNLNYRKLY